MSRSKKQRNPKNNDIIVTRNRSQQEVESRKKKHENKHKGKKSGSRHSPENKFQTQFKQEKPHPLHGSKKKVPLTPPDPLAKEREALALLLEDRMYLALKERMNLSETLGPGLIQYLKEVEQKINQLKKIIERESQ